jgi:hypothetical protein
LDYGIWRPYPPFGQGNFGSGTPAWH